MTDLRRRKDVLWRRAVTPAEREEIRKLDAALKRLHAKANDLSRQRYIITNRAANRALHRAPLAGEGKAK